jgi:bacillithiol system protein YtxJ
MNNHFVEVSDLSSLEELIARSYADAVILFKHSRTCSISARAYEEMTELNQTVMLVLVQTAREVSNEIEARTGVTHESPQVIVLRNGTAVWHASHGNIKAWAVEQAARENA